MISPRSAGCRVLPPMKEGRFVDAYIVDAKFEGEQISLPHLVTELPVSHIIDFLRTRSVQRSLPINRLLTAKRCYMYVSSERQWLFRGFLSFTSHCHCGGAIHVPRNKLSMHIPLMWTNGFRTYLNLNFGGAWRDREGLPGLIRICSALSFT